MRRSAWNRAVAVTALMFVCVSSTRRANAVLNAGVEAGVVKRTAAAPDNLNLGFGYGAHAEMTFESAFAIGAYYLHSTNSIAGVPSELDAKAKFETLGVRGRLILPMPGRTKPYALIGLGHNWITYGSAGVPDVKGQSWEVPVAFGIAHQVLRFFQLSIEGGYRASFSFSGHAYDDLGLRHPDSGWSLLGGIALDF